MTFDDTTHDDSAARFALLELDIDPPAATPIPAPTARRRAASTPAPTPVADSVVADVVASDLDRAVADEAIARAAGFSPKPPIYTIGTPINSTGVGNLRQSRSDYDALPTVEVAMAQLAETVRNEQRADVVVDPADLQMSADGKLELASSGVDLTERCFTLLAKLVTPGGGSYLSACPPDMRADHVNHWLAKRSKPFTLRTRINAGTGQREAFAVVSQKYQSFDADVLASAVAEIAPPDARCDVSYDGTRTRINVLFHTDIKPERGVAGEIFKAGVCVKTSDDGTGAIHVDAELWRNLCLNLIILDHAREKTMKRSHLGDAIRASIEGGIDSALDKVQGFASKWSAASVESVIDRYGCDVPEIMSRLARNRIVHVPGVKPADMADQLMSAWRMEPGYMRSDIVNAVTRAAHGGLWSDLSHTEELERQAGQLLYARVWNVADAIDDSF